MFETKGVNLNMMTKKINADHTVEKLSLFHFPAEMLFHAKHVVKKMIDKKIEKSDQLTIY